MQQQAGSFDFYRTMVGATGPLTKDDTLLYRVNLAYENSGSFRNFIAPTVTWNISPQTQATAEFEYQHISSEIDGGIAPMGNRPAPVPISRNLDKPIFNGNVSNRFLVALTCHMNSMSAENQ